jgi:hypothetical protein
MRRSLFASLLLAFFAVVTAAAVAGPPSATASAEKIVRQWRGDLRNAALDDPKTTFANPPRYVLLARLRRAAAQHTFDVVRVEILHPSQSAPLVVIRTENKMRLVRAVPAIWRVLDPKANTGDDRTGWAYEGFLLEALDSRDVPFFIIFNHWRGAHAGGGQWATAERFLPFAHG